MTGYDRVTAGNHSQPLAHGTATQVESVVQQQHAIVHLDQGGVPVHEPAAFGGLGSLVISVVHQAAEAPYSTRCCHRA